MLSVPSLLLTFQLLTSVVDSFQPSSLRIQPKQQQQQQHQLATQFRFTQQFSSKKSYSVDEDDEVAQPKAGKKKVLVLGGDGFCGWPTSLYLSDQGHDVVIVDNLSRRNIDIELGCDSLTPIQSPEVC
jgi:regulator of PEP synthase PpsR (kinase-PPPase family)